MQQPLYGLIGGKLGHSYSKIIHEKIADYTYELLPLPTEAEARTFMEKRAFAAINVTIPYKQFVIPYCDVVDPKAQAIGAVNTIVNRDGKLYGYNTDYAGFAYLAGAHGVDFAGKTVLILGTGGTHSTVTAVCRDGGAKEILTASRTGKGDALLYSEAMHRPDVQIIVNTTPCGMFPNVGHCLIDPKAFPALEAVLDVVYNPFRTELLLRAEDCGVTAAGGFEMLVAQAVFAAEHFTGRKLDTAAIIPAVSRELRHQLANVSIIGMPGCGKSTVGAALAKRLDKKFVDLDAEIERRTGHNIPDIFAQEGEDAFRRYEADVLAEVAKGNSQVIACGGGVIKNPANTRALRQNLVAYVPQSEEVDWSFPVLVEDVVMMGRYGHMGWLRRAKPRDREIVDAALARVGMSEYRHRQIGELSGGQKKRVFLARAIAQQGQVILLDEPFTGVDVQTEARIISLLRELRDEGCTMLVSTHNLGSVSEFCDYTVMVKGTVLASGPTETTFTAENLERAFSGVLRHVALTGAEAQIITDDERPFISRRAAGGPR